MGKGEKTPRNEHSLPFLDRQSGVFFGGVFGVFLCALALLFCVVVFVIVGVVVCRVWFCVAGGEFVCDRDGKVHVRCVFGGFCVLLCCTIAMYCRLFLFFSLFSFPPDDLFFFFSYSLLFPFFDFFSDFIFLFL